MIVIVAANGERAELPGTVLALMSYPASFLANFLTPFPVRVAGLPDPEVLFIPLAMGVLGFVQWFVFAPKVVGAVSRWSRATPAKRGIAGAIVVLVVWVLAELVAIVLSTSLDRLTKRMPCHLNPILFHAWLAIPMSVAAATGGLVIANFFDRQDARPWTVMLASLFFVVSTALQAVVLFAPQSTSNRIGALIEVVLPVVVCFSTSYYASRSRHEHAAAGASQ